MHLHSLRWILLLLWSALAVIACSSAVPSATPAIVSLTATQRIELPLSVSTSTATNTILATHSPPPSFTAVPAFTNTPAAPPSPVRTPIVARETTPTFSPTPELVPSVAPEIVTWLQGNAIPLSTTHPNSDSTDLMPLREIIGDARVVALGEATHGTHEFLEMKHRLFRFLVEEMGFTVLAVEDSFTSSYAVNKWIHGSSGEPQEALAAMGWNIRTNEVVDLIRWMRDYNSTREPQSQLSFYSFDLGNGDKDLEVVRAYIRKVDPGAMYLFNAWYVCMPVDGSTLSAYRAKPEEEQASCRNNLTEAHNYLLAQRSSYEAASSPKEWAYILQTAQTILQNEAIYSLQDESQYSALRQQYMADNASWILNQAEPGEKIVLWAHNGHVRHLDQDLTDLQGLDVVSVGFTFYDGEFMAYGYDQNRRLDGQLIPRHAPLPPPDSYEHYFQSAGLPSFILDLQEVPAGSEATDWLHQSLALRSVGCCFYYEKPETHHSYMPILAEEFDLIVFLEQTSPSAPLDAPDE